MSWIARKKYAWILVAGLLAFLSGSRQARAGVPDISGAWNSTGTLSMGFAFESQMVDIALDLKKLPFAQQILLTRNRSFRTADGLATSYTMRYERLEARVPHASLRSLLSDFSGFIDPAKIKVESSTDLVIKARYRQKRLEDGEIHYSSHLLLPPIALGGLSSGKIPDMKSSELRIYVTGQFRAARAPATAAKPVLAPRPAAASALAPYTMGWVIVSEMGQAIDLIKRAGGIGN